MDDANSDRWRRLAPQLDRLLDLAPADRERWLASQDAIDPDAVRELRRLLAARDDLSRAGFLAGAAADLDADGMGAAGTRLGPWTLVEPLGAGGMGVVWRATRSDGRFDGEAAIKLLGGTLFDGEARRRFAREGAILARLRHPGIAQLLDAGVSERDRPYLVLELVRGRPIDAWCDEHALDPRARVAVFLQVLDAVAAAHAQLVIHRDLKPSNVLVDDAGRVRLLDFGIARLVSGDEAAADATRAGAPALTPAYAAPEQFGGGPLSTAADVYSLGVLLYALLCGRHPSGLGPGAAPLDYLEAARRGRPRPPSGWAGPHAARLRGDLDTIVLRALAPAAADRYPSVLALHDDLRRFLNHEPIAARPPTIRYRASKLVRRRPLETVLVAIAVASLLGGLVASTWALRHARDAAAQAEVARARAERETVAAREQRDRAQAAERRASALNDLNQFVLSDAAPGGRPLAVGALLERAVPHVERNAALAPDLRIELLAELAGQFATIDDHGRALGVAKRANELAAASRDPSVRAAAACTLARVEAQTAAPRAAEQRYLAALAQLPDRPETALQRIDCLRIGATIAAALSADADAVARAEEARRRLDALPDAAPLLRMRTTLSLAEAYREAGRPDAALRGYLDAASLMEQSGRSGTEFEVTLRNNLGLQLSFVGRLREALQQFDRAVEVRRTSADDRSVSPMLLTNRARALWLFGRNREALADLDAALARARAQGSEVVANQAAMMRVRVLASLGRGGEADAAIDPVAVRLAASLPPGHYALSAVDGLRARALAVQGRVARALPLAERFVAVLANDGRPLPGFVTESLFLGDLRLQSGDPSGAREVAERALVLARAEAGGAGISAHEGSAYVLLGRAAAVLGDRAPAREALLAGLQILRDTVDPGHPDLRSGEAVLAKLDGDTVARVGPQS